MKLHRSFAAVAAAAALMLATSAVALAEPQHPPTNPNACVGTSSTTANVVYQPLDPDKLRSDQARQDDGQPGRADSVDVIPQCQAAGLDRGHDATP